MGGVFNLVLSILLLMGVGYFIKKVDFISETTIKELSKLVINVIVPTLIIISFSRDFSGKLLQNGYSIILFAAFYFIFVFYYYRILYIFMGKEKREVMVFLSMFANTVYLGFPVIYEVVGEIGIFYAVIYNFVHTVFLWTLGVSLVSHEKKKLEFKNILTPPVLAMMAGLVMFSFSIKLPIFIANSFKILGGAATPLAMIVVGYTLASLEKNNLFQGKLILMSISKLFVLPAVVIFVLSYFKFDKDIAGVLVLQSSMPCSTLAVLIARKFKSDYHLVSQAVFISTLFSILSIPFAVYLYQKFL